MNITSGQPSIEATTTLKALQQAVANNLEKKRRLGHYAVIWQENQPVLIGDDAPTANKPTCK